MKFEHSYKDSIVIPKLTEGTSTIKQYTNKYAIDLLNQKNRPKVNKLRTRNQIGKSNLVGLTTRMKNDVSFMNGISRIILKDFWYGIF